jgi:hypothetical protein
MAVVALLALGCTTAPEHVLHAGHAHDAATQMTAHLHQAAQHCENREREQARVAWRLAWGTWRDELDQGMNSRAALETEYLLGRVRTTIDAGVAPDDVIAELEEALFDAVDALPVAPSARGVERREVASVD